MTRLGNVNLNDSWGSYKLVMCDTTDTTYRTQSGVYYPYQIHLLGKILSRDVYRYAIHTFSIT